MLAAAGVAQPQVRHQRRLSVTATANGDARAGYTEAKTTFIEAVLAGG